jgi:hypothetical protein
MSRMPSISETVERLLNEDDSAPVVPQAYQKVAHLRKDAALKAVGAALQALPEKELNYAVLHVVKTAMVNGQPLSLPAPELREEHGDGEALALRKIANALREEEHSENINLLSKGAQVLKATKGLMLLRDIVRE